MSFQNPQPKKGGAAKQPRMKKKKPELTREEKLKLANEEKVLLLQYEQEVKQDIEKLKSVQPSNYTKDLLEDELEQLKEEINHIENIIKELSNPQVMN